MPEAKIRLELTIPLENVTVNALIIIFKKILVQLVPQMVTLCLETYQEARLDHRLGPRWSDEPQKEAGWNCPECGSHRGFNRRGSRPRMLQKTSLGQIEFQLFQVTCRRCGKTFAPFSEELSIDPYQTSTPEFQARAVETACQLSYRRSANMVSSGTLTSSISATAIHNWVQEAGNRVSFQAQKAENQTVILDSTKVKAGEKERGAPLKLGFALTGRSTKGYRPHLDKHPVAFGVDEDWKDILAPLESSQPERTIFDGGMAFRNLLDTVWPKTRKQRCLWHLSHQMYFHLLRDGLGKVMSDPIRSRLNYLLMDSPDLDQAKRAYQALVDELRLEGLKHGAKHLQEAQKNVFTFRKYPEGVFSERSSTKNSQAPLATSPLEREMREVNRRTDNGSRWSIPGVKNMISLDLSRRYDDQRWQDIWDQPQEEYSFKFSVKVQAEMVYSNSNVKTG
ncbi:MAG: transposase [Anaerolineales bacterium]